MSFLHEPPIERGGPPPEELDALLGEFFRAEMPQPWPDFAAPRLAPALPLTPPARPWKPVRSRVALAASVGLLLTGSLLLPLTVSTSDSLPDGTDIGKNIQPFSRPKKVRTPDGEEFEMKEFLNQGKDGTEIRIDFDRR